MDDDLSIYTVVLLNCQLTAGDAQFTDRLPTDRS